MLDGHDRIGDSEREIVVGVHSLAGFRIQHVAKGLEAVCYFVHQKSARGIRHVDAVRAI
jgi:hypothetical protein